MEICDRNSCTGCTACAAVCPKQCIQMVEDEIGHFFPEIDEAQCIRCQQCKNICPTLHPLERNIPQKTYAAVSCDEEEYMRSSSGGAASVFARHIIDSGGAVYGCTGTRGYDICHIRVECFEQIAALKGSKYVESKLGDTLCNIKRDLSEGRKVLLFGTPCQIAGAKRLFGDFSNFYSVDLICHGVPPQKLLKEHLQGKLPVEPDEIAFRTGSNYCLTVRKGANVVWSKSLFQDLFLMGFNKSLYSRESCYRCPYADKSRTGDITLGDFWGVHAVKEIPDISKGLSVVLVNTDKGRRLLEECKDKFYLEEHALSEAVAGNAQLRKPSQKHKNTDKFRRLYPQLGFRKAAKRCLIVNRVKYIALSLYLKIKK